MRVGILGGVFNPPHLGHLICAQEAFLQLDLDVVVFVPAGRAPHRPVDQDPGPEARLEMCRLATADDERFEVSRLEIDRDGPSYTADTLHVLHERSPEDEHVLILGADQAAALAGWREPERVLELAGVAVAERDGVRRDQVADALSGLRGAQGVAFFDMPRVDISSTLVRRRAADGQPLRYLVPPTVADFIGERGLYRAGAQAGTG